VKVKRFDIKGLRLGYKKVCTPTCAAKSIVNVRGIDKLLSRDIFQPVESLTVRIYNHAISPYDECHSQAWAATLVLMTLMLARQRRRPLLHAEEVLTKPSRRRSELGFQLSSIAATETFKL